VAVLRLMTSSNLVGSWTWKVTRFPAIENPGDVIAGPAKALRSARSIAYHGRNCVEACQRHQLFATIVEEREVCEEQRSALPLQLVFMLIQGIVEYSLRSGQLSFSQVC
jgi:hypothetical protein